MARDVFPDPYPQYGSAVDLASAALPTTYTGNVKGAWAGNTVYVVGDVVTAESGVFRCIVANTANAAGFRYDRNYWEAIPVPVLAPGSSVPVRQLDTTNFGAGLTTGLRAGIFQRSPLRFNYSAERVIWAFKAPTDVTTTGAGITTSAGTMPGGSIVTTRNSGTATSTVVASLTTAVDLSGNVHLRIPAKITSTATSVYFVVTLSSTGSTFTNSVAVNVITADPPAYGWRTYSIPLTEFNQTNGTGVNLAAINGIKIEVTGNTSDTLELSRVTYHPNVATKAKVMLWLDDGALGNQSAAIDVAARYGLPVTLASIAGTYTASGAAITVDKARYIQDVLGGQIAVHAFGPVDHDRVGTSASTYEEMLDYQHFGLAAGLGGVTDLGYFNTGFPGISSADTENIVRKMFRSARATGASYPETLPPGDPWRTRAFMPPANSTFTGYYQPLINRAIACKGLVQIVWHALGATDLTEWTNLCAWLDANRATVETTTPQRAFDPLCV